MIAALLVSLVFASPLTGGAAIEGGTVSGSNFEVYRDGDLRVTATRGADNWVHLTWPDGRSARAKVNANAIARLPAGDPLPIGVVVVRALMPSAGLYLVRSTNPRDDGLTLAARLADELDIIPDLAFARRAAFSPPADDPRREGQWYLDVIGIDAAWALSVGDPSVVIAVVDNGCDTAHPDLSDNMLPGKDLVDHDDDPQYAPGGQSNEHGTACAGIIAGVGDNQLGIAGVCPTCRMRCVRLLPDDGSPVTISDDVEAFNVQLEWNVAVSSNSWGFVDRFPVPAFFRVAITNLMDQSRGGLGAIVVFAAGNDHREVFEDELYGIPGVLTVGAINAFDEAAQFSNYGTMLDLVAPTGSLTTDISGPDGANETDYTSLFGGTSAACPVVAGVAGLLVAAAPDRPASELSDLMVSTVRPAPFAVPDDAGHDTQYGFGVVDPAAALAAVVGPVGPADEGPEPAPDVAVEPVDGADTASGAVPGDGGCGGAPTGEWALVVLLACAGGTRRLRRRGRRSSAVPLHLR